MAGVVQSALCLSIGIVAGKGTTRVLSQDIVPRMILFIFCFTGTVHKLIIPKSQIDDEAEYSATVGQESTKAPLWVNGQSPPSLL